MKLTDIASQMFNQVGDTGKSVVTLPRGLELTLIAKEQFYYLKLCRPAPSYQPGALAGELKPPSPTEVQVCKKAFFADMPVLEERYVPEPDGGEAYWLKVAR